jgi:hypothetical protein
MGYANIELRRVCTRLASVFILAALFLYSPPPFPNSYAPDHPSIAPSLKYVNPTYMVRSVKANAADNVYCTALAHGAVHGAMGGFTNFMVGPVNSHHAMIPLGLIFARTNVVSITDEVIRHFSFFYQFSWMKGLG